MIRAFKFLMLSICLLICISCDNRSKQQGGKSYILVYYERSFIDSELNCDYDFEAIEKGGYGEIFDLGEIILKDSIQTEIKTHIAALRSEGDSLTNIIDHSLPLHFQANFYERDSLIYRLCIDNFNRISIDGNVVRPNDTLIYLLKRYSKVYNYFPPEELAFFEELQKFGLPSDYVNLSQDSNANFTLYNKMILL